MWYGGLNKEKLMWWCRAARIAVERRSSVIAINGWMVVMKTWKAMLMNDAGG
jgi:hypothetical protein